MRLLAYGFLLLGVMGWLRVGQALPLWRILESLQVWPGPLYLVVSGAVWGLFGLVAAVVVWIGFRWARSFTIAAALLLALSYWFDRLFLVQSDAARANLPFALIMTVVLLVFTFATLRGDPRFQTIPLTPISSDPPEK